MATPVMKPEAVIAPKSEITKPVLVPPALTDEQIAQRAYEIFEREGSVHGNDQQHWYQAIDELTAEAEQKFDADNQSL